MDTHPGGKEVTLKLLELARIEAGKKIIDLGAGRGESVFLLKEKGFEVVGIDLINAEISETPETPETPESPASPKILVLKGDMCALDYSGESFDAALAECSFSVCGDLSAAIAECARVLKDGGKLLISDVYYKEAVPETSMFPNAVTVENFKNQVQEHGLQVHFFEDISEVLKEHYLESVWKGGSCFSQTEARSLKSLKIGYFMMICIKR